MADTTTIYGWPYQEATDPPDGAELGKDLAEAIEATVDSIDDRVDVLEASVSGPGAAKSAFTTAAVTPLSSTANSPAQVLSLSYTFKQGYAYRVSVYSKLAINGATSSGGIPYIQIRRASAAGTLIHDPGGQGLAGGTGDTSSGVQSCVLKRTGADTTQTISFCATWSGTGTAINVKASSTARSFITIEPIGLATDFTDALEVPTS